MVEPKIDALRAATANASDVRSHVEAILQGGFVPDDLIQHTPRSSTASCSSPN
jgi:fructuronate reductase